MSITVFDANADRNDDLAIAHAGGTATVLNGDGLGGFTAAGDLTGLRAPGAVAARDFNGDGLPDLMFAEPAFAAAAIFANTGSDFAAPVRVQSTADTRHLTAADFDADGDYELVASGLRAVVATNLASTATRGDGNRDGSLSAADFVPLRQSGSDTGIAVERTAANEIDVNGDGRIDPQDERSLTRRIFGGPTT